MCGLVGVAGNLTHVTNKAFRDMLIYDQVRGMDSTGVAFVPLKTFGNAFKKEEVVVEKDLGTPGELWHPDVKSQLFDGKGIIRRIGRCLIGHNRAATIGKVTVENAHPFNFGGIYGTHNGSLKFWHNMEDYKDLDVDSKGIFNTINKKGIEHTWSILNGAAALVWWDDDEETLNIIRNKERPLYYATDKARRVLFWASEYWMIRQACERNNIELHQGEDKIIFRQFAVNHHYKFKPSNTSFEQVSKVELKPYTPPVHKSPVVHGNYNKVDRNFNFNWKKGTAKAARGFRSLVFTHPFSITSYVGGSIHDYIKFDSLRVPDHVADKFPGIKGKQVMLEAYPNNEKELSDFLQKMRLFPQTEYRACGRLRIKDVSTQDKVWLVTSLANINPIIKETKGDINTKTHIEEEVLLPKSFRGWLGTEMDENEFRKALHNAGQTCCCCGEVFCIDDHKDFVWIEKDLIACKPCDKMYWSDLPYMH